MFILIVILIYMCTFVTTNQQIDEKYRGGFLALVGVISAVILVFNILL